MPSPFDITVASNTVTLDNKREGIAAFTVKNNARRRLRSTAKVSALPNEGEKWLTILPPEGGGTDTATVRDFAIDSTQQYQVKIAVPLEAPPSSYTMKLKLADEVNPDENFTESPEVIFTVVPLPKPEPRPFPKWIIPVVAVAIIVIIGIVLFAVDSANRANANATATADAIETARVMDETNTAIALLDIAQQTAAAETLAAQQTDAAGTQFASQTAAAQEQFAQQTAAAQLQTDTAGTQFAQQTAAAQTLAAGTQQALNVFTGSWQPINTGVIEALGITDADNNRVNITYKSHCPPNQNLCLITSQNFELTNVLFTPTQLAAGGTAVQLLIVPFNSGQLLVSINASGELSQQTFRRNIRIRDDLTNVDISVISDALSAVEINTMRLAPTPGP